MRGARLIDEVERVTLNKTHSVRMIGVIFKNDYSSSFPYGVNVAETVLKFLFFHGQH